MSVEAVNPAVTLHRMWGSVVVFGGTGPQFRSSDTAEEEVPCSKLQASVSADPSVEHLHR